VNSTNICIPVLARCHLCLVCIQRATSWKCSALWNITR